MTPTAVVAALAGVLAAAGLVDAAAWRAAARDASVGRRRRRRRDPSGAALQALQALGRRLGAPASAAGVDARVRAAGTPFGWTVPEVMAAKAGAALAGGLAGLPLASLAPGRLGIVVLAGSPVAGFLAPDLALRRRAARRAASIALELPDVAELLRVAVQAGLPPTRALAEVGRRHPGLLARELAAAADRMSLGVAQDEALEHLAMRAPVAGVTALTAALRRAAAHGAPLDASLDAIAADARAERARRVRDRAARAAPKIQLIVALLLVPAVLLLIAAALVPAIGARLI